jgi:hypothetical protein
MRIGLDLRFEYDDLGQDKIELLKRTDIIRMAETATAVKQMLLARAGYKAFVVVAYLSGKEEDFKESLCLLENTARKVAASKAMPTRPRFIEQIFQE